MLCDQAREHLKQLRVEEGEAAARQAVELDPQSDDAHTLLGIALCRKGRNTEGIEELGRAVVLNPANVTARSNLAIARQQAGHLEAARAEWTAVLSLDPNNTKARGALAVVEWQIQQATGQPQGSAPPVSRVPAAVPPSQPAAPPTGNVRYDLAGNPIVEPPAPTAPVVGPAPQASAYPQVAPRPRYGAGASSYTHHQTGTGDDPGGWSLANIGAILSTPGEFFESQRGHYGIAKPLVFSLINAAIIGGAVLLLLIFRMVSLAGSTNAPNAGLVMAGGLVGGVVGFVVGLGIGVLIQFATAGIVHLLARMLGGSGPYGATYRALVYAGTPVSLMYIIGVAAFLLAPTFPIAGGLAILAGSIWTAVLAVIGVSRMHDISGCAAFGALVLGFIVLIVIWFLITFAIGSAVQSLMPGSSFGPSRSMPFGDRYGPSLGPSSGFPSGPPAGFPSGPPSGAPPSPPMFRGPSRTMPGFPGGQ
jgi:hypothetical protein